MICPQSLSPPIFLPLPFLIQPHLPVCCYLHMPGTIPTQALCPYATCRYSCGYFLNPFRSLFLREASLNSPTKKIIALPPTKLLHIPLFCFIPSTSYHPPTYYMAYLFIINTAQYNMSFMRAGTLACSLKVFRNYLVQTLVE